MKEKESNIEEEEGKRVAAEENGVAVEMVPGLLQTARSPRHQVFQSMKKKEQHGKEKRGKEIDVEEMGSL